VSILLSIISSAYTPLQLMMPNSETESQMSAQKLNKLICKYEMTVSAEK